MIINSAASKKDVSEANKRKICERSERLKVLGKGSHGVRLGCGVLAAPWANTYGVLAVGESPFTKGFPPLAALARASAQRGQVVHYKKRNTLKNIKLRYPLLSTF